MARARFRARSSAPRSTRPTIPTRGRFCPTQRSFAKLRASFALHAGVVARPHLAVRRRRRHFRTDFDGRYSRFRIVQRRRRMGTRNASRCMASWSRAIPPGSAGQEHRRPSHFFNSNANLRFQENRYGFIHQFNWDVKTQSLLQQRIAGYYNAQCCGFSAEYQIFDLTGSQPRPSRRTRGSTSRSPLAASETSPTSSARWAAPIATPDTQCMSGQADDEAESPPMLLNSVRQ